MPVQHEFETGAQVLKHFQSTPGSSQKKLIFQDGEASGDISHVVSALAVDDDCMILVVGPKGKAMADGYVDSYRIAKSRVLFLRSAPSPKIDFDRWKNGLPLRAKLDLSQSTAIVNAALDGAKSEAARKELRQKLREAIRGGKYAAATETDDGRFERFIKQKSIQFDKDIVVLWGRTTGKDRGQHTNLDSSSVGLYQLASRCATANYSVIFAGDVNATKGWQGKEGFTYFGQFWNDEDWTKNDLQGRLEQTRLFYVMKKRLNLNEKGLVHVGMRSGSLDAYAFAQQHTIYIVPKQASDNRIAPLVEAMKNIRHPQLTNDLFTQMKVGRTPKARYQDENKTVSGEVGSYDRAQAIFNAEKQLFSEAFPKAERDIRRTASILNEAGEKFPHLANRGFSEEDMSILLGQIQQMFNSQRSRIGEKKSGK